MKKVFAILLVLALVAGSLFATTGDKLVLSSDVGIIKPEFKIIYAGDTSKVGTTDGVTVTINKDISLETIEATFNIVQKGEANSKTYCKYNGSVELTIALSPFKATVGDVTATQSTSYTVTGVTIPASKVTETVGETTYDVVSFAKGSTGGPSTTITPTYYGRKADDLQVGTVTGTWVVDPSLPVLSGTSTTYTANVTLTYSVQ